MPVQSVGDLSQQFSSLRSTGRLKNSLATLSNELSTERKSDLTSHLRGATVKLETISREISILERYSLATKEVGQQLLVAQASLESAERIRSAQMQTSLNITRESSDSRILDAASSARQGFEKFVSIFNARSGDTALFGGARTDANPLASADVMLADLELQIAGLTSAADISAAVTEWFQDPAGGFQTFGYQGDTGQAVEKAVGPDDIIKMTARADAEATKALLQGTALAALADSSNSSLSMSTRAELVQMSGQSMLAASEPLIDMQSGVGLAQMKLGEAEVTNAAQSTAFQINRNSLVSADPFETATRLQGVQQQLEMHFAVTARLSRLSLANYL